MTSPENALTLRKKQSKLKTSLRQTLRKGNIMTKQNRFFKPLALSLAMVLAVGSLTGCESEAEKQARLYREYIAAGGNPQSFNGAIPPQYQQPAAPMQQPQYAPTPVQYAPAPVVVQQAAPGISAGEAALLGMAAGAFMTHALMSPRSSGESDYSYNERRRRWEAEDSQIRAENRARYERQKAARLRSDNGDLRRKLADAEKQNRAYERQATQQKVSPAPTAQSPAAVPAQPMKTQNPAMFEQKAKDGANFSRQPQMPAQQSVVPKPPMVIPAQQKPAGGGMFGSSGGSTSRSSIGGSPSRSGSSRSK